MELLKLGNERFKYRDLSAKKCIMDTPIFCACFLTRYHVINGADLLLMDVLSFFITTCIKVYNLVPNDRLCLLLLHTQFSFEQNLLSYCYSTSLVMSDIGVARSEIINEV